MSSRGATLRPRWATSPARSSHGDDRGWNVPERAATTNGLARRARFSTVADRTAPPAAANDEPGRTGCPARMRVVICAVMAPEASGIPGRQPLGVLLLCVLAATGCGPAPPYAAPDGGSGIAPAPAARGSAGGVPVEGEEPFGVRLDALPGRAAAPGGPVRNPFRFGPAAAPPSLTPGGFIAGGGAATAPVQVDGWRPAEDPSALRFIGVLEAPESAGRVAVLSDGAGVYHGRVDDVVGGRWRIVALDRAEVVLERSATGERLTLTPGGG